jgi:SAM-dependent methyltransferase
MNYIKRLEKMIINEAKVCRICKNKVKFVADFGLLHLNNFPNDPLHSAGKAPVILDQCEICSLVQLRHTIDPKILYGDHYWYQSGLNQKIKQNLFDIADIVNKNTKKGDIVLDIGANDGTLLSKIETDRYKIGCEPAPNLINQLKRHCNEIISDFWNYKYLGNRKAKIITAIGMFYDLDDPNDFINDVAQCLCEDGIFIAQLMTLAPMVKMYDLGNICHEHLEYYTYKSLVALFERNGLEIYKIEENDIQGGSYQIYARHYKNGSIDFFENLDNLDNFLHTVKENGIMLRDILKKYVDEGKSCFVYGASTKGNTLLQYWNLGEFFEGAAEIHQDKIGRYTVGTKIPIISEEIARKKADVFFVPNFGFRDVFIKKEQEWINNGGKMVFAMPKVEVV